MASLKFDITGDNSGFIQAMNEIQSSIKKTEEAFSKVEEVLTKIGVSDAFQLQAQQLEELMAMAEKFGNTDAFKNFLNGASRQMDEAKEKIEDLTPQVEIEYSSDGMQAFIDRLDDIISKGGDISTIGEAFDDVQSHLSALISYGESVRDALELRGDSSEAVQSINDILSALEDYKGETMDSTASVMLLREQFNVAKQTFEEAGNAISETSQTIEGNTAATSGNTSSVESNTGAVKKNTEAKRQNASAGTAEMSSFKESVDNAKRSTEELAVKLAALAGISFSLAQVKAFVDEVVSIRTAFQDLETSTKVFLGSAEKAAAFNERLKNYSLGSLFHYNELMQVSQQMLALGMDTEQAMHKVDQLANIAAATHESLSKVVSMYTRAQTMGQVMTRQLVTWQNLGVNVKAVLKEMGQDISKTTISFEQLDSVINRVTAPGGMFANTQAEMLSNVSSEIDTYRNKLELMFNEIGERYQDTIVKGIRLGTEIVDNYDDLAGGILDAAFSAGDKVITGLADNYKTLAAIIRDGVVAFGLWKTALLAANAVEKAHVMWIGAEQTAHMWNTLATEAEVAAKGKATVATVLLERVQAQLNATIMKNPYVLAAAALAALVFTVYKLATAETAAEEGVRKANEELERQSQLLKERQDNIRGLIAVIQDQNATSYAQLDAYKKLKAIAPEIADAYTQEQIAAMNLDETQKLLNKDFDDMDYEQAKKNVDEYTKKVEQLNKRIEEYFNDPMQQVGDRYGEVLARYRRELTSATNSLESYRKQLEEIEKTREEVERKNRPIEVQVQEANQNYQVKKQILDFYNDLLMSVDEVNDANNGISYVDAERKLYSYINEIRREIENLRKELEDNPGDVKLQLKLEEKQKIEKELLDFKDSIAKSGVMTIPVILKTRYERAEEEEEKARNNAPDGTHWEPNLVNKDGGQYVLDTPKVVRSSKKWRAELKRNADAAQKLLDDFNNGTGEYAGKTFTEDEYKTEYQRLTDAVSAAKKALGSESKQKSDLSRETQRFKQLLDTQAREKERAAVDTEYALQEARIKTMEDGTRKTLAQLALDFERQKTAIERGYEDLKLKKVEEARKAFESNPANKGKLFNPESVDTSYTQAEQDAYRAQLEANQKAYTDAVLANQRADRQAIIDYLREYGTMQERKLAIAEEYAEKIREIEEGTDTDEVKAAKIGALMKQQRQAVSDVSSQDIQERMDWAALFQGTALLQGVAQQTLDMVREFTQTDAFREKSAEDKQTIYEAMANLQREISGEKGVFGSGREVATATAQLQEFSRQLVYAKEQQEFWEDEVNRSREALENATDEEREEAQLRLDIAHSSWEAQRDVVTDLKAKTQNAASEIQAAAENFHNKLNSITSGIKSLATGSGLSDMFSGTLDILRGFGVKGKDENGVLNASGALGKAGGYIGAAFSLADVINEQGLDKLIGNISNTITKAVSGIIQSVVSGEFLKSVFSSIGDSFMAPFDAIFGNGNMEELKEEVEALENSNKDLEHALDGLKDNLEKSSLADAQKNYNEWLETYNSMVDNYKQIMSDTASMWERGSHSIGAMFTDEYSYLTEDVNKALGTTFRGLGDMLKEMSPEQWSKVYDENTPLFTAITTAIDKLENEHTGQGLSEIIRDYASLAGEVEEQTDRLIEKTTGITFDTMFSNWKSKLSKMGTTAADFASDVQNIFNNIIITSVAEKYEDQMKDIQQRMSEAARTGDWYQYKKLEARYKALSMQAQNEIDTYREQGYIKDEESRDIEASGRGYTAMSQEMGSELSGRFAAFQESNSAIKNEVAIIIQNMNVITTLAQLRGTAVAELRELAVQRNGFLGSLVDYNKKMYEEFSVHLEDMAKNLKQIV